MEIHKGKAGMVVAQWRYIYKGKAGMVVAQWRYIRAKLEL
jgi:hypothetical protein